MTVELIWCVRNLISEALNTYPTAHIAWNMKALIQREKSVPTPCQSAGQWIYILAWLCAWETELVSWWVGDCTSFLATSQLLHVYTLSHPYPRAPGHFLAEQKFVTSDQWIKSKLRAILHVAREEEEQDAICLLWHSEDSPGYAIENPRFGIKWNFTFCRTFWVQCRQMYLCRVSYLWYTYIFRRSVIPILSWRRAVERFI